MSHHSITPTGNQPPNSGRGRTRPLSTSSSHRSITNDGRPPNNGNPHPTAPSPPSSGSRASNIPVPIPHPFQVTPPQYLGFFPASSAAPQPTVPVAPAWEADRCDYVMMPSGPVRLPSAPNNGVPSSGRWHSPPRNQAGKYRPPSAIPLEGGDAYYLPPSGEHITLLYWPSFKYEYDPWTLYPSQLGPVREITVPASMGVKELIRRMGAMERANAGITTMTLCDRATGAEVDMCTVDVESDNYMWRRGETYTLGEKPKEGKGEAIDALQGFRDQKGKVRKIVGVACYL